MTGKCAKRVQPPILFPRHTGDCMASQKRNRWHIGLAVLVGVGIATVGLQACSSVGSQANPAPVVEQVESAPSVPAVEEPAQEQLGETQVAPTPDPDAQSRYNAFWNSDLLFVFHKMDQDTGHKYYIPEKFEYMNRDLSIIKPEYVDLVKRLEAGENIFLKEMADYNTTPKTYEFPVRHAHVLDVILEDYGIDIEERARTIQQTLNDKGLGSDNREWIPFSETLNELYGELPLLGKFENQINEAYGWDPEWANEGK